MSINSIEEEPWSAKKTVLAIFCMSIPFLIVFFSLLAKGKSISDCVPVWGDELWWWQQTNAVSAFGKPLGYWGYNGNTARIGTFASWGLLPAMPYGLFAMSFGWSFSGYVLANLFYQTICVGLFIWLVKPDRKGLLLLLLLNATQVIRNGYLFIAMQECVRCALGLVAAGLLIRLYRSLESENRINGWFLSLTAAYLLLISHIYLIWVGFFFPFFLLIQRRMKHALRFAISAIENAVLAFSIRYVVRLTSSPFPRHIDFKDRVTSNLYYYYRIYANNSTKAFFKWFHGGLILCVIVILLYLLVRKTKIGKEDRIIILMSCAVIIGFIGGHFLLYETTLWTFTRGVAMGVFVAALALAAVKSRFPARVFCLWGVICVILFYSGNVDATFVNEKRFRTPGWEASISETQGALDELYQEIKKPISNDPWDYTVATYSTDSVPVTLSLPAGYSINSSIDRIVRDKTKWIVIGKIADAEKAESYKESFQDLGYVAASESEKLILMKRE